MPKIVSGFELKTTRSTLLTPRIVAKEKVSPASGLVVRAVSTPEFVKFVLDAL
jgi:hypothetical protein